jgi:uncharacterized protein (TIGR01777 family)
MSSYAVSGASGLIGSALAAALVSEGHTVRRLVRHEAASGSDEIFFDPTGGRIEAEKLEGLDALIHLAGENVAAGRWTAARKGRIRRSRLLGTRLIAETLAALDTPPPLLLNASAIGFYGDRGDELLDESSAAGDGFLASLCREWEEAAEPAREAGIRVVKLRIGVVLSCEGGALKKMLPPFRLGLGGRLGDGRQYVSWIALRDLVRAIIFILGRSDLGGIVNGVAPAPVRNSELTAVLARLLGRPALLPAPAALLRLALGEMAGGMILASGRVMPNKLLNGGFSFEYPDIESALKYELSRKP